MVSPATFAATSARALFKRIGVDDEQRLRDVLRKAIAADVRGAQLRRPYFSFGSQWSVAFASVISFIKRAIPSKVCLSVIRTAISL